MLVGFILLFLVIIAKLFMTQIIQHQSLTKLAEENWDIEVPFGKVRGQITDRHNTVIVGNRLAPTIYFMPSQNNEHAEVAQKLSAVLSVDTEVLLEKISKKTYMIKLAPEGKNVSDKQAKEIAQLKLPGVYVGVDFIREYPHDKMLSRLLGFTGYDGQGLAGIEFAYDKILQGKMDNVRLYTDAKGIPLPHVDDKYTFGRKGTNVQLTIDLDIQKVVERELQQAMEKYEAKQALAIVLNPSTGEILSLASMPTFHPAEYQKVSPEIYNRNLPVWMTFEPGSTFKIITLAAGLEEQVIRLQNDRFFDPGYVKVANARLRCWQRKGHGSQTYLEVVENSCNPGFVDIGQRLGQEKLQRYIEDFGFGQSTNSKIAGESKGILFSKEAFGPVEQATTSFGQGISVTPIQQVQAVAAAINGGNLMTPFIVKGYVDDEGKEIQTFAPEVKRKVIKEETSKQVREALESVVAKGSGRQAYRDGLRVGGKTGTAQKVVDGIYKDGEYIVSFIGFAPADNPEVLVYVAIDSPQNSIQFGGVIAAPIVGTIIEEVAPILNIEKRDQALEKDYRWGDELTQRVPDLTGMTREMIRTQLHTFQIEWHGEGDVVTYQIPKENTLMRVDDPVHVYANK